MIDLQKLKGVPDTAAVKQRADRIDLDRLQGEKASVDSVSAVMAVTNTKASVAAMNQRVPQGRKINGYDLTVDRNLTAADVGAATPADVVTAVAPKANTAAISAVGLSGQYADLIGKPTIPTVPVSSVQGRTGAVVVTTTDLGLNLVSNTSDSAKPVSTAQQAALDLKADTTALTTGLAGKVPTARTVAGKPLSSDVTLVKGDVGLSLVDNTADSAKPVSGAQQTALSLKADSSAMTTALAGKANDLTVIEKNLGSLPRRSGHFDITGLTGLTANNPAEVFQLPGPYTGKGTLADEAEMDAVHVSAYCKDANSVRCYWLASGAVRGNFKFGYRV